MPETRRRIDRAGLLVLPAALFAILVLLCPLAGLVGTSFSGLYGVAQYRRLLATPVYAQVLERTIGTAAATALLCAVLAFPVAHRMAHAGRRGRAMLLGVVLLPFWTNLLVRSYGWMVLLNPKGPLNAALLQLGVIRQPLALVYNHTGVLIGMVQIMLPYMVLPLAAVMARIEPQAMRAARSLGAGPVRAFLRVYLPLSLPGVMAGALLVFTVSLGFFVVPAILGGPRDMLLAQLIEFNINTTLDWPFAAAIGTVLLASTLLLYGVAVRWLGLGALWGEAR